MKTSPRHSCLDKRAGSLKTLTMVCSVAFFARHTVLERPSCAIKWKLYQGLRARSDRNRRGTGRYKTPCIVRTANDVEAREHQIYFQKWSPEVSDQQRTSKGNDLQHCTSSWTQWAHGRSCIYMTSLAYTQHQLDNLDNTWFRNIGGRHLQCSTFRYSYSLDTCLRNQRYLRNQGDLILWKSTFLTW